LGARVGEEHARALRRLGDAQQRLGERDLGGCAEEVRDVPERAELGADRRGERGVGVAERVDGDAGEQVEVALAVGVPHVRALAAHQDALRRAERVHDGAGVPVGPGGDRAVCGQGSVLAGYQGAHAGTPSCGSAAGPGTTMVPFPRVVKTSSSTLCGWRPSMTVAAGTPPSTARRHASIFGTMPASRPGRSADSSGAAMRWTSDPLSGHAVYSPSTSVSTMSFLAPRATASADAAVSALTLSTCVGSSLSGAIVETTGMRPACSRSSTARRST